MQRVNRPEILDTDECPASETQTSLRDLCRMNRWFGGVSTTRNLFDRVCAGTGKKHLSILEVAAGFGEVPRRAAKQLEHKGIQLEITMLDRLGSHLLPGNHSVVADALQLPFPDCSYDVVSCSLFTHHLEAADLQRFVAESLRVSRRALLINDLIRHPMHLALVYAGFPLMRSHVSRVDGIASVHRAYQPEEMRELISAENSVASIEISRHYLFRMGVIVWKKMDQVLQGELRAA